MFTLVKREDDILDANKLWIQKKQKIQESKPEKKFKCEKYARTYKQRQTLSHHQNYACEVMPQFSCEFCGKGFKHKHHVRRHIDQVHLKISGNIPKIKHICERCFRSYKWASDLMRHKRSEHAAIKAQYTCDTCDYKAKRKAYLFEHITLHHILELNVHSYRLLLFSKYYFRNSFFIIRITYSFHLKSNIFT